MRHLIAAAFLCVCLFLAGDGWAQQATKIYRIGWLGTGTGEPPSLYFDALRSGLRDLGYVEGRTYVFEKRWWNGRRDDLPALVDGLVGANVDVIVVQGPAVRGVRNMSRVPVVFGVSGDPVAAGLVQSLGRPGGNLTGITMMSVELNGKRLELLREALPRVGRIGLLSNPAHPGEPLEIAENHETARRLGLSLHYVQARTAAEIDVALATMKAGRAEAIVMLPDGLLLQNRAKIIGFAARERIPAVSGWAQFTQAGALMTYGPNLSAAWRRLALYVDKILKGARPADLPVERPTRFELVVNLKTARALGIAVPPSVLLRATEVIE